MPEVKIINSKSNPLISLEIEKICLGALFKFGNNLWAEVAAHVNEECFSDQNNIHKIIFLNLRKYLDKGDTFDKVLIANDIKNLKISSGDIDVFEYCDILSSTQVTQDGAIKSFQELIKLKIARELFNTSEEAKKFVVNNIGKPLSEIIAGVDKLNNEKINSYHKDTDEYNDIFEKLENVIEDIGNNPPDESKFMMGPFKTINNIYGSLHKPGNITVIGSRSGVGKTAIGMFVNYFLAKNYDLPILHLDNGEMSPLELQIRAMCMLTDGKVPYWAIETGKWRNNPEWTKQIRVALPLSKKIKFYYEDISGLSAVQIISLIRRFSFNKIGRGNLFGVHFDYLKPFDTQSFSTPEWKEMGHAIQDFKSFITNEIQIPFWTSLQLNRSGITNNKSSSQVDDSEGSFGISDRITQQSSHSVIVRNKTFDEIMSHGPEFGNLKAIFVKHRHLGKDFDRAINLVKVDKKKYEKNFINISSKSFSFEDRGDLIDLVAAKKDVHDVKDGGGDEESLL